MVDGVIKLGESVAHFGAAHKQLKALGKARVGRAALGKGRNINRVHGDEGGLNHLILNLLVEAFIKGVTPSRLDILHVNADALRDLNSLFIGRNRHKVNAQILLDGIRHGKAAVRRLQADLVAEPSHVIRAQNLFGSTRENALKDIHHYVKIGIGFVKLNRSKFGVMAGIHALIAEDTADFVHALQAADNKALQIKLGGDAKIHIKVKGVMVRDKGAGGCAAGNGVENRGFNFHIAARFKIAADKGDELRANDEVAAAVVIDNKVNIALAVFKLGIRHAVVLLGQGAKRLGKKLNALGVNGDFLGLGFENVPGNTDDIADIELAEIGKFLLADGIGADIHLDKPLAVLNVAEDGLAHAALRHNAPGNGNGFSVKGGVIVYNLARPSGAGIEGLLERVSALILQCGKLVAANLKKLGQLLLVIGSVVNSFAHLLNTTYLKNINI